MLFRSVTTFLLGYVGYTVWKVAKLYLGLGSLSHIPGPPRASWWMGTSGSLFHSALIRILLMPLLPGNFGQIYNKDGWAFHDEIREKYGGVFKVNGLFGVGIHYLNSDKFQCGH